MMKKWSARSKRNSMAPERNTAQAQSSSGQSNSDQLYASRNHNGSNVSLESQMTVNAAIVTSESQSSIHSRAASQASSRLPNSNSGDDNTLHTTLTISSLSVASKARPYTYDTYDTTVIKTGWINKGHNISNWSNTSPDSWKIYKAELKGPVLSLYKLPAELNIKSFDVNNGTAADYSVRQKRMSQVSRSDLKASIKPPTSPTTTSTATKTPPRQKTKYLSELYPHPDLQLNESNAIVSGSLESICHTIICNTLDDDKLSYNLLLILPLFGDLKSALKYFIDYSVTIIPQSKATRAGQGSKILVSNNTDYAITQRLGLVITTIVDSFPGMLLDPEIIELAEKLLSGIALHDERLSHKLKLDLTRREGQMNSLTNFRSTPYDAQASRSLTKVDSFLALDINLLAEQINIIDLKFNKLWNPKSDPSLLYELENFGYARINPLIFNSSTNIHYLGRLIVNHLFGVPDPRRGESQRARVLEKWIEIGCVFDKIGDMVSWLAIATVICSMPILRLRKSWSLVEQKFMKIISSEWAPVVFELDRRNMISEASHRSSYHVIAPQGLGQTYSKLDVVPYFGDLTVKYTLNSTLKQCEKKVQRVKISFSRWDEYLLNLKEEKSAVSSRIKNDDPELQKELYNLLSNHVNLEPLSQEVAMELSLSSEPDSIGSLCLTDERKTSVSNGSYLPTLFTEVLPTYRLFDQGTLLNTCGFADKNSSSRISSQDQAAAIDVLSDELNHRADCFHVGGDLVFKLLDSLEEATLSNFATRFLDAPSSKRLSLISNSRFSDLTATTSAVGKDEAQNSDVFAILDASNVLDSLSKPLNVALRAGTLDKMVDVLVLTANVFTQKINKEDTEKFSEKSNLLDNQYFKLKLDNGVFTSTFFATYKSFTTTASLLEALSKKFSGAKSAAISIAKLDSESQALFPDWDSDVPSDDPELNWYYTGTIQIGVLEALSILVTEHYADFTDDLRSKQIFVDLLRTIDNEIVLEWRKALSTYEPAAGVRPDLKDIYEVLSSLYKKIRKTFIKKCYRPLDVFPKVTPAEPVDDFTLYPLPGEFREAEIFVNELDAVISDLFSSVTTADWIHVSQLFEIQSSKSLTSLFKYKSTLKDADHLEIMNVFSWIRTLFADNPDDLIFSKFPPPVKTLLEAHDNLEKYFILQITDCNIARKERNARMASILQILTISRLRMQSVDLFNTASQAGLSSPSVPSFIETAVTQAIVSPASRAFDGSWLLFAGQGSCDDLSRLLLDLDSDDLTATLRRPLTPCPGWFVETLMEILNFVPNTLLNYPALLNFDKRRFIYNCVSNISDLRPTSSEAKSNDFDFLLQLQRVPTPNLAEVLGIASEEGKELQQQLAAPLFKALLEAEGKKTQRDSQIKEELENQDRDNKRAELLSRASQVPISSNRELPPPNEQQTSQRKGRHSSSSPTKSTGMRRFGGLFKSVRPFSINVGSNWSGPDRVVHPDELPNPQHLDLGGKHSRPYQQIKLFSYKPLFVHTNIEGFFKMVSENGGEEFYFQATSNAEAQSWITALTSSKRYTYLSKDARGLTSSKVFGVPISDVCDRESLLVPAVVDKLLTEIEERGLDEIGLYRIPGSVGSINLLKQAFDEGTAVVLTEDIHTLAGCFKAYLRDLPESLLTNELLPDYVQATKQVDLIHNLRQLSHHLPVNNYHVLKRLFEHLHKVVEHSETNRMDAVNLAIVFSMSFIDNDNLGASMGSDLGALQNIIQCLIKDPDSVFGEQSSEPLL